jgi:hypothetical protein
VLSERHNLTMNSDIGIAGEGTESPKKKMKQSKLSFTVRPVSAATVNGDYCSGTVSRAD